MRLRLRCDLELPWRDQFHAGTAEPPPDIKPYGSSVFWAWCAASLLSAGSYTSWFVKAATTATLLSTARVIFCSRRSLSGPAYAHTAEVRFSPQESRLQPCGGPAGTAAAGEATWESQQAGGPGKKADDSTRGYGTHLTLGPASA